MGPVVGNIIGCRWGTPFPQGVDRQMPVKTVPSHRTTFTSGNRTAALRNISGPNGSRLRNEAHALFVTARIRRMGEGTVFSLFVSPHLGGGGTPIRYRGGNPSQIWLGGVPHPRSRWGGVPPNQVRMESPPQPGQDGVPPPPGPETGDPPGPGTGYSPPPRTRDGVPPPDLG